MRLKVSCDSNLLFDVEIRDGKVQYWFVAANQQSAVLRWIDRGLFEWVPCSHDDDMYDSYPRETQIDHPDFLIRVKDYLERQFHFTYQLTET